MPKYSNIKKTDPKLYKLIIAEEKRQKTTLNMIPSENYTSDAVLDALGSVLTNKYSEGYANRRYYQGNEFADKIELLAIERAKELFGVPHANVQAYSGSPANSAVFFALLEPGDKVMGLELAAGGHLTHGHPKITFSGKFFKSIQYGVGKDGYIDYDELEKLALKHKPKLIVSGTTAYPRFLDFKKFAKIADKIGAWHLADISHIAGLVAAGAHPSPIKYADVVMFTAHKTMRGPRSGTILVTNKGLKRDEKLASKIDKAVFPGLQGGPHDNVTAALATTFKQASTAKFKKYAHQVVENAKTLADELTKYGFDVVSGGTDMHLVLVDVSSKGLDGWSLAWALEYAGIILNRNSVPFDKRSPFYPSGIRMGTPWLTTIGMKKTQMKKVAKFINEVTEISLELLEGETSMENMDSSEKSIRSAARKKFKLKAQKSKKIAKVKKEVEALAKKFN